MAAPTQTTQVVIEVLDVIPVSPARVTQVVAEVVDLNANESRVSQLLIEYLSIPRTTARATPCPQTTLLP